MNKRMNKGFTLVEIMIVVAIIAILAAVAIPNFVRYRKDSQKNACISNLKQLQTAAEQYAMANPTAASIDLSALVGTEATSYIKHAVDTFKCPAGTGTYKIEKDDAGNFVPKCDGGPDDHVLP